MSTLSDIMLKKMFETINAVYHETHDINIYKSISPEFFAAGKKYLPSEVLDVHESILKECKPGSIE